MEASAVLSGDIQPGARWMEGEVAGCSRKGEGHKDLGVGEGWNRGKSGLWRQRQDLPEGSCGDDPPGSNRAEPRRPGPALWKLSEGCKK